MGKKILLADDSITIQKVIELTFSDEDFEVVTVGNGRLAIEKVQETRPDVVLCDIIMPEKDGYEVCDFIKKHAALSHIPVLLLTGAFEPFDQERATRVGCDGFLAKPFEPQALIAKVRDLLRQSESRQPAAPAPAPAPPVAAAPPAPRPAAPPEPSPSETVWAAPGAAVKPVWEPAPETRPAWTPPPPPPAAEVAPSFIPEDPFSDEASGFAPTGSTANAPSYSEPTFEPTHDLEPYAVPENPAAEGDLLPMSADEAQTLSEPMGWSEPAPVPEPPSPVAAAAASTTEAERDLFLAEVFEQASSAMGAAEPAPAPEPEPHHQATSSAGPEVVTVLLVRVVGPPARSTQLLASIVLTPRASIAESVTSSPEPLLLSPHVIEKVCPVPPSALPATKTPVLAIG